MRHQKKKVTLDRKTGPRTALLKGLAESLILYEKINTTKAKAKAVRSVVEKLITRAKVNTLHNRRELERHLITGNTVKKLLEELGPRYAERKGGYTRTIVLKNRVGDGAEEVLIELV
jgi:large subunit ribosomal protein L17